MDGFFSEQPCYRIEILEWINEEDITDEWRYIWKHDPPEPVYEVMMGGFVESLNLAFVYESIYTRSEYEQIRFRIPTAVVENPYSHGLPRR